MKQEQGKGAGISRRRFFQIVALSGAAGFCWQFGLKTKNPTVQVVRQSRTMMGTQINLVVYGPDRDSCEDAIQSTFARMDELIGMLSRHNPESELSTLNRQGILERPGNDIREVLLLADQISKSTDGAFDVTVLPLQELYSRSKIQNSLPAHEAINAALQLVDYREKKIQIRRSY